MLRDITLGQFFPGNTFIHRLDPRTKLLAVILYIVALFNAQGVVTYAIVAALLKDGRAHVTGLHSEKSGKTYDATVVLEDTGQYVNFKLDFDRQKGGGK